VLTHGVEEPRPCAGRSFSTVFACMRSLFLRVCQNRTVYNFIFD